jgi:ABC-type multidrug transport system fused ATPase/permease subunit
MQTKESIAKDWTNQRCKPQNMLFAGLITHPEGTSAFQYTNDNFQFCVQNILSEISAYALQPFQFMISALSQVFNAISEAIQQIREIINRLRNSLKDFAEDVLGRILNIITPIQKIFISLMDTFQKIQGTMTAGLYTMLGSYYTLQALMGAILELIVKILLALVIIIVALWILPFTWPVAASMTVVFLAIAIPLAIIIYFMTEVLHIKSSAIPQLRCFDENTPIKLYNGDIKPIKDIQVGESLSNESYVTAKIKVTSANMKMFKLNKIIVSESHLVKYK